jgi:hypothetical protein
MQDNFPRRFTAGAFAAAAAMLWLGWMLLPTKLGTYFEPSDFAEIGEQLHLWLWLYRVHLFGMVMTAVAVVALAALLADRPARVMIWPGAAIVVAGMIVGAVGAAFYYHHGVWGAIHLDGKPADEIAAFVETIRFDTEYITCLTRFSRVFSGLGLVLIGAGLIYAGALPKWLGGLAILIGLAAMTITMGWPDHLDWYLPVFHALAAWLLAMGAMLWGARLSGD